MRDYAKVSPKFWTGETGQELARRGSEALVVALYLMTSPHSNMLGLFYQPVLYLAEESGLSPEGALKGLQVCKEVGFCDYDPVAKMVWVYEMASYQIASELSPKDLRCKGIQKEYTALPNNQFLGAFFDRYGPRFNLTDRRDYVVKGKGHQPSLLSPYEAPTKPRAGTEKEQEQEFLPPSAQSSLTSSKNKTQTESPDPKGSRLAPDWLLPDEWAEWCRENRPDLNPASVADGFRDFWVGKAGAAARKADWKATWRNWCRGQKQGPGKSSGTDWTAAAT